MYISYCNKFTYSILEVELEHGQSCKGLNNVSKLNTS